MSLVKTSLALVRLSAVALIAHEMSPGSAHKARMPDHSSAMDAETTQAKITRALSAGPPEVSKSARVIDTDAQGDMVVLREGSDGFTCMPGNPKVVGEPPMCADAASMQWAVDFKAHRPKPTNSAPGIIYMLAGATQRSDSDPYDTTSPPIQIGPHWMIMWPFDPKTTELPVTHWENGAYIMWAGSPYAHLHVTGPSVRGYPISQGTPMSKQQSFVSTAFDRNHFYGDLYANTQLRERALNAAIAGADISESFEDYLAIFDAFYADDIEVSSETANEPIHGKARVRTLLANFLYPIHAMAEIGGLLVTIRQTTIAGGVSGETHSAWTLEFVGTSGKTCILSWRVLRKWDGSRVVYEYHYDEQQSGGPLTLADFSFNPVTPAARPRRPS